MNRLPAERNYTLGIIGAGDIVLKHHLPVLAAIPRLRIAYVADVDPRRLKEVKRAYGFPGILIGEKIDALPETEVALLATPVGFRGPYYRLFASRKTAVLSEKPLACSEEEGNRICGLFEDSRLACGFQRRTYNSVHSIRTSIENGWFGKLNRIRISEGARTGKTGAESRFYDSWEAAHGGILRDLGCHSLDLMFYVTKAKAARVEDCRIEWDGHIDREVQAHLSLKNGNNVEVDFEVTWLRSAANILEFHFERCRLSLDMRPSGRVMLDGTPEGMGIDSEARKARTVNQAFFLEWEMFLRGLDMGIPTEMAGRTCLPGLRAIDDLYAAGGQKN